MTIKYSHILPFLGFVMILYRSHIPGGSIWNLIGTAIFFVSFGWHLTLFILTWAIKKRFDSAHLKAAGTGVIVFAFALIASAFALYVTFQLSRKQLIDFVESHKNLKTQVYSGENVSFSKIRDIHAGPYPIIDFASFPDGGTYLVTTSRIAKFDIDERRFGFAYKPSADETPFKGMDRPRHLDGDWYIF